jgi:hypothetical protein
MPEAGSGTTRRNSDRRMSPTPALTVLAATEPGGLGFLSWRRTRA